MRRYLSDCVSWQCNPFTVYSDARAFAIDIVLYCSLLPAPCSCSALHFASLLFFFFPNLIIHRCFFACCCCFFPAGAAIPLVKISCIAKYF